MKVNINFLPTVIVATRLMRRESARAAAAATAAALAAAAIPQEATPSQTPSGVFFLMSVIGGWIRG